MFAPLYRVIRSILSHQFHSALYQDFKVVIRNFVPHRKTNHVVLQSCILSGTKMVDSGEDIFFGSRCLCF